MSRNSAIDTASTISTPQSENDSIVFVLETADDEEALPEHLELDGGLDLDSAVRRSLNSSQEEIDVRSSCDDIREEELAAGSANAQSEFVCECSSCFPSIPSPTPATAATAAAAAAATVVAAAAAAQATPPRRSSSDNPPVQSEKINRRYTETHFELGSEGENYQSEEE